MSGQERLDALKRSGLLDTPPEEAFDRLTKLASRILKVPVSLVSLVDDRRQFFKSQYGLDEPWASRRETPLSHSFCKHVVSSHQPLVVEDARTDPGLSDNLAVSELGVIAYAGVPLNGPDGETLGSFCAIDTKPRRWTAEDLEILTELANSVLTEIHLKIAVREAESRASTAELERNERVALLHSTTEGIVGLDLAGQCTFVNRAAARMLGVESRGAPRTSASRHYSPYARRRLAIPGERMLDFGRASVRAGDAATD